MKEQFQSKVNLDKNKKLEIAQIDGSELIYWITQTFKGRMEWWRQGKRVMYIFFYFE